MLSLKYDEMWVTVNRYSLKFEDEIQDSIRCVLCRQVLRNAKQISCGCRFCAECLINYINSADSCCPGDSEECQQQVFSANMVVQDDNFANKEISKLMMNCVCDGCDYRDSVRNMCQHILICDFFIEVCSQCGENVQRSDKYEHLTNDCPETELECEFCHNKISRQLMASVHHGTEDIEQMCDLYECVCPYECGEESLVVLKSHLRVCTGKPLCCPFRDFGCGSNEVPRSAIERHLCQEGFNHARILLETITNLGNEMQRLERTVCEGKTRIDRLENEVLHLREENSRVSGSGERRELEGAVGGLDMNEEESRGISANEDVRTLCQSLSRRLDLFDLKYEKKYFEYVWRVTNYKNLVRQALQDHDKSIKSDQFFTSRHGYRLEMILFPNGLGDARNRNLSLFFQLVVGKFDDVLSWPFKYNVEIRLLNQARSNSDRIGSSIDQSGSHQDHVVNLFFDPTNEDMITHYGRPPMAVDVPLFGCQCFISKDKINRNANLRKNDTLFIQFSAKPVDLID